MELRINELQSMRFRASANGSYTQEIVRRALFEQTDESQSILEKCFYETIRTWIHRHPSREMALKLDTEENYIAQAFSRFWYATRAQNVDFTALPAVLSYLHATLNGAINDAIRFHAHTHKAPYPRSATINESAINESIEAARLWEGMQKLLCDEREKRIFYLLYACGLKPREIVTRWPQEFPDVKEIYQLNKNIVERLSESRPPNGRP